MTHADLDDYERSNKGGKQHLPDIVLVKKCYPNVRKRQTRRYWKLAEMNKEQIDENNIHEGNKKKAAKEDRNYLNQKE